MNRNRLIVGVLVAAVVAFLASTFVYRQFQQVATARPASTQQIVVASEALPVGTRLTTANVKLIGWPSSAPMAGQLTNVADAVDRAVITNVSPNEPILEAKLAPRSAGAGLPATIPEGMRAVSVAVNDVVGVAGFVTPGTSVDVLVTGQIPGANQNSSTENITRTILENVRVLAAGQKIEQDRDGKPQTVPVVTLLVMPEDAARLTMASTEGKIQLALRNTIDAGTANPDPVLQAVLFGGAAPPPPPKTETATVRRAPPKVVVAPSPYTVEVIIGDKRETKSFPNSTDKSTDKTGETDGNAK